METILRPFKRMRFHEPQKFMKPSLKRKLIIEERIVKKRTRFDFQRITAVLHIQKIWRGYKERKKLRLQLFFFYSM